MEPADTTAKQIISGVKPTGRPHLGNYFGAMRQFVELQTKFGGGYFFIADYHGLNLIRDGAAYPELILGVALDYLAIGISPEESIIFKQSDVPEHTELCWIFNTITTMPYLMRAHAFKDAEAKNKEISVGTFDYPMLMAADILLYSPRYVPVGQDQKQHIEFTRDTAEKFNTLFGTTFTLPEPYILEGVATVPGIDGQKMSKSYGNTISLFAPREEIATAVMGIVTDSSGERPQTVFAIHSLFRPAAELEQLYTANAGKYKVLKEALIEDIDAFIAPLREKRALLAGDLGATERILTEGADRARAVASEKMRAVRNAIGVSWVKI
jgi:tryptophanyl-tRNA synthetase